MARLPAASTVIIPASPAVYMAGVIPYPYRPAPDFLYLTGIKQQGIAILRDTLSEAGRRLTSYQLYLPTPSVERQRWDGASLSPACAVRHFGADHASGLPEVGPAIASLVAAGGSVFLDPAALESWAGTLGSRATAALASARDAGQARPLQPHLHALRWTKSPSEQRLMREAATIAADAMLGCIQATRPGVGEGALAAQFEHACKSRGAARLAYPPVVASGSDACTIHYSRNDKAAPAGSMLLMDAGCEFHGYASDITRTWPVGGRFTAPQRALYETVLEVHRRCVDACVPGATLQALHRLSCVALSEGLARLGILPGPGSGVYAKGLYKPFYPHSLGHYLGLDTHDTPSVSHDRGLEAGTALTVEPGLYIPPGAHPVYGGMGVRIEDDVLITARGAEVLSAGVPVEANELERLAAG